MNNKKPGTKVYEAWWWTNPPQDRNDDLASAKKTCAKERSSLKESKQDIFNEDPEHGAFIDVYEIDEFGNYEWIDCIDDPR
jgi:hypothetical protein